MLDREARHRRGPGRRSISNDGRSRSENRACSIARYCRTSSISSSKWHFVDAMTRQRPSQYVAQLLDDADGAGAVVVTDPHRDRVQRVEQKVRVDLRLQRSEPRPSQLLRQPRHLHFAIAHFDEVANRVCEAGDGEVHHDAERQRPKIQLTRSKPRRCHSWSPIGSQPLCFGGVQRVDEENAPEPCPPLPTTHTSGARRGSAPPFVVRGVAGRWANGPRPRK